MVPAPGRGHQQATEWVYTGRVFPASEAQEGGLVRSISARRAAACGLRARREIADNTAGGVGGATRQMLWRCWARRTRWRRTGSTRGHRGDGAGRADAREGIVSFLEKHPPAFTMTPSKDMPDFYPWFEEPEFS